MNPFESNFYTKAERRFEEGNINDKTGCLCLFTEGKNRKARLHDHEFFEVFLSLGDIVHYINGQSFELCRGTLVFIKPSDIHAIGFNKDPQSSIINLIFKKEVLKGFADFLGISYYLCENLKCNTVILNEMETVACEKKLRNLVQNDTNDMFLVKTVLFELLIKFFYTENYEYSFPEWFENMCREMKKPMNFSLGINRMCEICGYSREYIARCMRKYINTTPTEYINDLKLSYAASMLINSDKSITDICLDAGFFSTSWFNKLFLKKYTFSPTEFRKRRKNYDSAGF